MNSLPMTVTRQRRDCDLNPGPSAPESSTLTTHLPSHSWSQVSTLNCECFMCVCAAMKVLDGDDVRLSAKGRFAERDIVQVDTVSSYSKEHCTGR